MSESDAWYDGKARRAVGVALLLPCRSLRCCCRMNGIMSFGDGDNGGPHSLRSSAIRSRVVPGAKATMLVGVTVRRRRGRRVV